MRRREERLRIPRSDRIVEFRRFVERRTGIHVTSLVALVSATTSMIRSAFASIPQEGQQSPQERQFPTHSDELHMQFLLSSISGGAGEWEATSGLGTGLPTSALQRFRQLSGVLQTRRPRAVAGVAVSGRSKRPEGHFEIDAQCYLGARSRRAFHT